MRISVIFLLSLLLFNGANAQTPETLQPTNVEVYSIQVTKFARNNFGKGKKPKSNDTATFWLSNSGTVIFGRLDFDRTISSFFEKESKLTLMRDDTGNDLTLSPDGQKIDTFFADNKPLIIKLDDDKQGCEFYLRGYGTPQQGTTSIQAKAELTFEAVGEEARAELKNVDIRPGKKIKIGPLVFSTISTKDFQATNPRSYNFSSKVTGENGIDWNLVDLVITTQATSKVIKSLKWLDENGKVIKNFKSNAIASGSNFLLDNMKQGTVDMVIEYYEGKQKVKTQLDLKVGLGF